MGCNMDNKFEKGQLCIERASTYYGEKYKFCIYIRDQRKLDKRTGLKRIEHVFLLDGKFQVLNPYYISAVTDDTQL
jgi:hypothetical protein